MVHALEKRGYVRAGMWTPECTVEHPEAGQFKKICIQLKLSLRPALDTKASLNCHSNYAII